MPQNEDHARLWLRGTEGIKTEIPEWGEFIASYDRALRAALGDSRPQRTPPNVWQWLGNRHRDALAAARNAQR